MYAGSYVLLVVAVAVVAAVVIKLVRDLWLDTDATDDS